MKKIPIAIIMIFWVAVGCNNKKNEEVKDDTKGRMEKVGEKVDESVDKMKDKLKEVRDTLKNKIHRATAPDSTH